MDSIKLQKYFTDCGILSRRAAEEAIEKGLVTVNGRPAKASYDVKVGDKIEIQFGPRTLCVEILQVADNVRKDDAIGMYKEV